MSLIPSEETRRRLLRYDSNNGLTAGVVTASSEKNHTIVFRDAVGGDARTAGGPAAAVALVPQRGDIALPQEGDLVMIGYMQSGNPVVLGSFYDSKQQVRDTGVNERHIGRDNNGLFFHGPFATVPKADSDPSSPPDGAVWYRTDLDEYRGVESGTKVSFDTTVV